MPRLTEPRKNHRLVAFGGNKLCAVSARNIEVLDSARDAWVLMKPKPLMRTFYQSFAIGDNIFVFRHRLEDYYCYDVGENKWSHRQFELRLGLEDDCCFKVP